MAYSLGSPERKNDERDPRTVEMIEALDLSVGASGKTMALSAPCKALLTA